jgi:hypothetical protein
MSPQLLLDIAAVRDANAKACMAQYRAHRIEKFGTNRATPYDTAAAKAAYAKQLLNNAAEFLARNRVIHAGTRSRAKASGKWFCPPCGFALANSSGWAKHLETTSHAVMKQASKGVKPKTKPSTVSTVKPGRVRHMNVDAYAKASGKWCCLIEVLPSMPLTVNAVC